MPVSRPDSGQIPPPGHESVLAREAVEYLVTRPDGIYVDGTAGLGGHTVLIAGMLSAAGRVLAIDRDEESLELARQRLPAAGRRVAFYRENFKNLPLMLTRQGIPAVDGLLLDLGISSFQLMNAVRGFSFRLEGPLDMRMDQTQKTTAADLVNGLPEKELADLIYQYGEERRSRSIARSIVQARQERRIATTVELAGLIPGRAGKGGKKGIHPATLTFQALRIAVNNELEGLPAFIERMAGFLAPGGRMVIITFHSLEDRIVKQAFQRLEGRCICRRPSGLCTCSRERLIRILTRKPVVPGEEEICRNPRARSAKLRAAERISPA